LPTKRTTKAPPSDRAVEQANYAAWKILAGADLLGRHDVKPGTIPERLWRRLYIQRRSPQDAADQAAMSAYNTQPAFHRIGKPKR
jgi:dihydropteroate synthase